MTFQVHGHYKLGRKQSDVIVEESIYMNINKFDKKGM